MKKILTSLTLAIFALTLAGCYFPGHDHYDGGGGGYGDHGPGYGGDHGPGPGPGPGPGDDHHP
ncbi:MAG: hypothetical protein P4L54_03930 [Acidocella sp.]|nr:hypothetical protein [Acidocella sp.]